jgi:hypothetical protein
MVLIQRPGDVLYFPPGWLHEVTTMGGESYQDAGGADPDVKSVGTHYVSWVCEPSMVNHALELYAGGLSNEDQGTGHRRPGPTVRRDRVCSIMKELTEAKVLPCAPAGFEWER